MSKVITASIYLISGAVALWVLWNAAVTIAGWLP